MGYHREVAEDKLTEKIIGIAIDVHRSMGSDQAEQTYQEALTYGLRKAGLEVESEKEVPVTYEGKEFGHRYVDLFVENEVVVELKVVRRATDKHFRQLSTNVRLLEKRRGLLINFGARRVEVRRYANDHLAGAEDTDGAEGAESAEGAEGAEGAER